MNSRVWTLGLYSLRRQAEQIDKLLRFAEKRVRPTERAAHKLFAELNKMWRLPLSTS